MNPRSWRRLGVALMATVALLMTCATFATPASAVPTAILRVVVTGPAGEVAPGVYVTGNGFDGYADGDGVFVTPVYPAAATQVCGTLDADSPLGGAAGWARTCRPVDVTPGTTTRVRIVMQAGAALSGRVTDARTGHPIAGAVIDYPTPDDGGFTRGTLADADGVWIFRNLTPSTTARRQVNVAGAFVDPYPAWARWGWDAHVLLPRLALPAGVVTTGVDTTLPPIVRLAGTVTDGDGVAIRDSDVVIRVNTAVTDATTTNDRGRYLLFITWGRTGRLCASATADSPDPSGLAEACRSGLFRQGIDVVHDFQLEEGTS